MRPFSRPQPQPSNRQGDERTPRPARARLNRETVDRAWESGAPTQHADYRTRSNNGQPPRNSWRNNQQSEHSSAQNGRKPFGPRPDVDGNRRFDRPSGGGNQDNRSHSFDTDRNPNQFGERRTNNYQGNTGNTNRYGARPGNGNAPRRPYEPNRPSSPYGSNRPYSPNRPYGQHNSNSQPNSRPPFREQGAERDYPRRSFDRDQRSGPPTGERPARNFDRDSRPPRSFDRDSRPPRDFDRGNRPPRRFERDNRPSFNGQQRDTQNPRWQSRPTVQRDLSIREQPTDEAAQEHFEGDYERFNAPARPEFQRRQPRKEYRRPTTPARPFQGKQTTDTPPPRPEDEERHVTRLPDGRVLKGPRPVQRKNAQFWTEISKEAESLVEQVEVPTAPAKAETDAIETDEHSVNAHPEADAVELEQTVAPLDGEETPTAKKRKPRKGPASSTREKKVKPATPKGPKPSQRGHKWPTP